MSFAFKWPEFSESFTRDARELLAQVRYQCLIIENWPHVVTSQALNKGDKPPIIADRILVKELNMGSMVRFDPEERTKSRL